MSECVCMRVLSGGGDHGHISNLSTQRMLVVVSPLPLCSPLVVLSGDYVKIMFEVGFSLR